MNLLIERIQKDLEVINSFTATPGRGISRFTFSDEYMKARSYVADELRKIGAEISTTAGGNLRGRLEGTEKGSAAVMTGSHIDSVFQGGRFDGTSGVVTALEAVRVIAEEKVRHRHPIDFAVFAEEEGSRFGSIMIGSRAWIGKIGLEDLGRFKDRDGMSYVEAMDRCGLVCTDSSILRPGMIKAMIELHIEQSLVLESKGIPIGIVEGINGIKQFMVTLGGMANHAGATPMGLRQDALQGAARIIVAVEEIGRSTGANTVATVGLITCEPNQANVIPGRIQFTLDIRNLDSVRIDDTARRVMAVIEQTCRERRLTFEINPKSDTPPVILSKDIVRLIEETARRKGVQTLKMPSGALHDSSILPEITEVGMIFVPSRAGKSHCPEEFTELEDIKLGAEILLETILKLAV